MYRGGSVLSLKPIWLLADITNACMAFPNLIGLLGLSSVVIAETKAFFKEEREKDKEKERGIAPT